MSRSGIFPGSTDLKKIIDAKGWTLYDASPFPNSRFNWEELERHSPAQHFEIGHNYFFVPIPQPGQTLRQAFAVTQGVGPSLRIDDPNESRWLILQLPSTPKLAIFSRLDFSQDFVVAFTAESLEFDIVAMTYDSVVETFRLHFGIITMAQYRSALAALNPVLAQQEADKRN